MRYTSLALDATSSVCSDTQFLQLLWSTATCLHCLNPSQEGDHAKCDPTSQAVDQSSYTNSVGSAPTWDDGALNAKSSAVLSELDELLHIIEQLSDDDLCACFNLHTQQYHHTKHVHSKDSPCPAANS